MWILHIQSQKIFQLKLATPPLPLLNRVCFSHTSVFFLEGWGITWGGMVTTHCHIQLMHNLSPQPPCKLIIAFSQCSNWTEVQLSIEFPIDKISYSFSSHHNLITALFQIITPNCDIMLLPTCHAHPTAHCRCPMRAGEELKTQSQTSFTCYFSLTNIFSHSLESLQRLSFKFNLRKGL